MTLLSSPAPTLALFCKVVDNYGDIGICWRLARQLQREHGVVVTLWVDDLVSFKRICPEVDIDAERQTVAGVAVRHWRDQHGVFTPDQVADIVIEFFAVDIPPSYIDAMAQRIARPVWLNLEGLTAEEWVEGCHTLPSPQRQSLIKYFFFPGYTGKTGGLPHEAGLQLQRQQFQADPAARAAFLGQWGVTATELQATVASLFCYPQAPVAQLFEAWRQGLEPVVCLVPEGVASEAIAVFLGMPATAGAMRVRGSLTVRVLPFMPQPDYDKLLWSCDLNFVRGEDSLVRAQWAGRPFIWHIYPQDENLHHVKLRAFLLRYAPELASVTAFSSRWNAIAQDGAQAHSDWPALWSALRFDLAAIARRSEDWQQEILTNGDLTSNLLKFVRTL